MAGFGLMPAGLGPFGLGTPAAAPEAPTGSSGSRYLNPTTRDYEVDSATNQFAQMPGSRQRVLLALLTARNSSGVLNFGTKMPGRMSETFEADSRAAINLALRHMIEIEKSIRVLSIDVERGAGGRARFTVRFFDLLTGQRDLAEV